MSEYATNGALLVCSCGATPSRLTVTSNTSVFVQGNPMATTTDKASMVNILPFGTCTLKPTISGFLPCMPVPTTWVGFAPKVHIPGGNPLLKDSTIQCACGGMIQFQHSGQTKPRKVVLNPASPQIKTLQHASEFHCLLVEECTTATRKSDQDNNAKEENSTTKARVVDVYWMEDGNDKKQREVIPDQPVTLYIKADDFTTGEMVTIKIFPEEGKKFAGNMEEISVSGKVNEEGIATIPNFKISYQP